MNNCCSSAETKSTPKVKLVCPTCGQAGKPVATQTLKHQVKPEHLAFVEDGPFNFCRTPTCEVVYFNDRGMLLKKHDVRQRIGLKETEGTVTLCYCFGFTEQMVRDEIRATGRCTIPQRVSVEVKAGNCACEIRNPQGSCCLGNVTAALKNSRLRLVAAGDQPA